MTSWHFHNLHCLDLPNDPHKMYHCITSCPVHMPQDCFKNSALHVLEHERSQHWQVSDCIFSIYISGCNKCFSSRDYHVATDGNFHHWPLACARDCPSFYDSDCFICKAQVDTVGEHIEHVYRRPSEAYKPKVPDTTIKSVRILTRLLMVRKKRWAESNLTTEGLCPLPVITILCFSSQILIPLENSKSMLLHSPNPFTASFWALQLL